MNPPDSNISCKIGENVKLGLQWIRTYSCFALPVWGEGSFTFLRSQRLNKVIHISKRIWVGVAFAPFGVSKEIMSGAGSLQSCPTLCDPMDWSPPGSCVRGTLQARILEWVAMPSSRGSFKSNISFISCIDKQFLYR